MRTGSASIPVETIALFFSWAWKPRLREEPLLEGGGSEAK
jgi:hypothetical protein